MEQKLFTKNFTLLVLGQASSLVGIGVFWMTCSPGHQIFPSCELPEAR